MNDENTEVQKAAVKALTAIGDASAVPKVIAALAKALDRRDAGLSLAAAQALGRFPDPAAIPALSLALASHDLDTRIAAAMALGAIGTNDAVAALAAGLDDSDGVVRAASLTLSDGLAIRSFFWRFNIILPMTNR
jgi:HEAT repeat protein